MKNIFLALAVLGFALPSDAFVDVCTLAKKPVVADGSFSSESASNYLRKLENECKLQIQFESTKANLSRMNVDIEQVSVYQAMRFVQRSFFTRAQNENKPIEKVYQTTKAAYKLPIESQSTEIWQNWLNGIRQLPQVIARLRAGEKFNLDELREVHQGLFTVSTEQGDFAWDPLPGTIKEQYPKDNPWWSFNSESERNKAASAVAVINQRYSELGLLPTVAANEPAYVANLLNVIDNAIYASFSRINPSHLQNYFTFLNSMLDQARTGQHMIYKNRLFSPSELAYFIQQYYVAIHPFYEGNGRTSRFMQEMVLSLFSLPPGSSGDLMDEDVLTPHDKYYELAMTRTQELLSDVNRCVDEYSKGSRTSYQCRLLGKK